MDAAASTLGLEPGLTLKEARRRNPHLVTFPDDPAADARLWVRLLAHCRRATPSVARDGPLGLVLNVTGAAPLHGSEAAMAERLQARFAAEGVEARWALADTPGLAWALALFGPGGITLPGEGASALVPLPVEALRLVPQDAADLRALGFKRIGAILERPRGLLSEVLEGRLGARLDTVLGHAPCTLALALEQPRYVATRTLAEPVADARSVLGWTRRLAEALEPQLRAHGVGARALELTLVRVDGTARRLAVRTRRPKTDPAALTRLFEGPLGLLDAVCDPEAPAVGREIEVLSLLARLTAPLDSSTPDLLAPHRQADGFEAFAESLAARLGRDAVEVARADPSTRKPERAARLGPWIDAPLRPAPAVSAPPPPPAPAWMDRPLRPLRLFDPPEPVTVLGEPDDRPPFTFAWRRLRRRVVRAEGPERLAPEWGREREDARVRDYYRVEDADGRRYWLFREGLYGEPAPPRWFVQGVFA